MRRVPRRWYAGRALFLGAAALLSAALAAIQIARVPVAPGGVGPVALLVTLQIAIVLGYLFVRHLKLWMRVRSLPGWMRRAERARLRESLVVAGVGTAAAALLTLLTPSMVAAPAAPHDGAESFVYRFALPERSTPELREAVPLEPAAVESEALPAPAPTPVAPEPEKPAFPPAQEKPVQPGPAQETRPEFPLQNDVRRATRQWIDDRGCGLPELSTLMRQGLPSMWDPNAVAAPHLSTGAILGRLTGTTKLSGDVDLSLDLEREVIGEGTTPGGEMGTEIAIGRRDVLRIDLLAMYAHGRGAQIGALVGSSEEGVFSLWWEHAFFGVSHRFIGYEREASFDFAVSAGFAFDMLDASIVTRDGRSSLLDVFAAAPAFGLSFGLWQSAPIGFSLDVTQSVPVNIGGQALMVTDLRAVMKCDLSAHLSIFGGYRSLSATFINHHRPFGGEERDRSAELRLNGPVVGVDIRF